MEKKAEAATVKTDGAGKKLSRAREGKAPKVLILLCVQGTADSKASLTSARPGISFFAVILNTKQMCAGNLAARPKPDAKAAAR